MNSFFFKLLKLLIDNKSLIGLVIKKVLNKFDDYIPVKFSYYFNSSDRPSYTYCCYNASLLAKRLNIKEISIIEFGVAGGNGLLFLEKLKKKIYQEIGIKINIYGIFESHTINDRPWARCPITHFCVFLLSEPHIPYVLFVY